MVGVSKESVIQDAADLGFKFREGVDWDEVRVAIESHPNMDAVADLVQYAVCAVLWAHRKDWLEPMTEQEWCEWHAKRSEKLSKWFEREQKLQEKWVRIAWGKEGES